MVKVIIFYTIEYNFIGDYMRIYLKALGYLCVGVLGLTLVLTIFHYFNLISDKIVDIIKLIIAVISVGTAGYITGHSCDRKGWLEGLKLAGIVIVILALLTLIFRLGFSTGTLIYYAIIVASSVIGSMIGINFKEKKK
jgi:putative membrane protein (TIGR04086 family)